MSALQSMQLACDRCRILPCRFDCPASLSTGYGVCHFRKFSHVFLWFLLSCRIYNRESLFSRLVLCNPFNNNSLSNRFLLSS